VRIPLQSNGDSGRNRTLIPEQNRTEENWKLWGAL